jgi:YVTN family beta-propeller protein
MLVAAVSVLAAVPGLASADGFAYATNSLGATVTPIDLTTHTAGTPIPVGNNATGIAITPDAKTAYVANFRSNTVTPIDLATNTAGAEIPVGSFPSLIAITPDGRTAYVANAGDGTVTPIDLTTNIAGTAIPVGPGPSGIAITPDGGTAYVVNDQTPGTVTPIHTADNSTGLAITVGDSPVAIAVTPDGKTAYVTDSGSNNVTPIDTASNTAGTRIGMPSSPYGIAITPDGTTAYVVGTSEVTPINLRTNMAGPSIPIGGSSLLTAGVAITPDGKTAYIASRQPYGTGKVTPIDIATNSARAAITVDHPYWIAITPDQTPTAAFTAGSETLGQPTSFDASASSDSDGTVATYQWSFGDGQSASTSSPTTTHTYAAAGAYTATLTVADDAGCSITPIFTGQTMSCPGFASARTHRQVVLAAPPVTPPAGGTAPVNTSAPLITGVNAVGQVLSVSTGSWAGGTPGYGYQWTRDGVPIPGATTGSYTVQVADQGHSLSCIVTASVGGASTSATAAVVFIAIIRPPSCPPPAGQLTGATLGPIALGLTQTRARRTLPRFDVRSYHTDNFCLSGGRGIRVGYASTRLLGTPSPSKRAKLNGKIILALTNNPAYALRGVRQGTPLAAAARQLKLGNAIRCGPNDWYIVPAATSNGVLKVRHSVIWEVGIANKQLTTGRAAQRRLLRNF